MIRAYPRFPSLFPGERLTLHVSTDSPRFRVEFYRQGARLERIGGITSRALSGHDVPEGPPDIDWGWPAYEFDIPETWPSGVYVAMLVEIRGKGREIRPDVETTFATEAKALFVVRNKGAVPPGTPLYKVSWATFVAYNGTGYGSLYTEGVWSREQPNPGFKATWRRPGCGTGGLVMPGDSEDFYDTSSRRQTFEHWDAPFVRWLEASGYQPHYCTDWELHRDRDLLAPYSLMLSVGHDEYWSDAMRAALDAHVSRGGNIAFFSGNISGYRIHFADGDTAITCAKILPPAKDPDRWTQDVWSTVNPECRITGVASSFGGGWWDGKRDTQGYTVQHGDHWVYAKTGLKDGDVFGDDEAFPLVGYEVDGAAYRWKNGRAVVTGEHGTPRNFLILGLAELGPGWVAGAANAAATMGIYTSPQGGIVFQGATTDWPCLVPLNRHVAQITRNVIEGLRYPSANIIGPSPHVGGRMLASAGTLARFHVDTGKFGSLDGLAVDWQVAGAKIVKRSAATLELGIPETPDFITVSATLRRGRRVVGFGTRSLLPLSREEALRVEVLTGMREMVNAGEPSNPLVSPSYDPLDRSWLLFTIRVPWIRDRAERIRKAAVALMAERVKAKPVGRGGKRRKTR